MKGCFPTLKAIILSGEREKGLSPLTLERPRCLLSLFGKPLLARQAEALRRCGVKEIGVVLPRLAGLAEDALGDGGELGVRFTWLTRREPLEGAALVRSCRDFFGEEDVLVLPGGAVWDGDLGAALAVHRVRPSAATLVLARQPPAPGRSLVLTDQESRVERLLEGTGGRLLSSQADTGACILTSKALAALAEGADWPLERLFATLLEKGEALYGAAPEGAWREINDPASYLDVLADALSGKLRLPWDAPRTAPGVWSASPIPAGVRVVPPVYVGAHVRVGEGSLLGPHAVLEEGSTVGRRALVQRSALLGAAAEGRTTLYGAVLCPGAAAGAGSVLNEGAVLSDGAVTGEDAILLEGVAVWPRRRVPDGARLTASLRDGGGSLPLAFGTGGTLTGTVGGELTAERLLLLGSLLGREGALGLGWSGGPPARMLAQAAGSGAAAAGARVISHDAPCPSAAAWLAESWALPASLFVWQEGEKVVLHLFDRRGLPLSRERQRRLEGALLRGQPGRVPALRVGRWETVSGVRASYAADGARRARLSRSPLRRLEVAVPGEDPADRVLAEALESLGCLVRRESRPGVPAFQTLRGGFALTAVDEEGEPLPPEELLAAVALIEYENGGGRVAVPAAAPAAIDTLAAGYHGGALRLGRDGAEAETRYGELPWLRDGIFAACRICARLGVTGERLRGLTGKLPRFALFRREVPLRRDGEDVLARLLRALPGAEPAGGGLRLRQGEGWVTLSLSARPAVLRVVGEARTAELARELCDFCARRAEEADRAGAPECQVFFAKKL